MGNLKTLVNSEAESKEVQGLLEKLGFKKFVWGIFVHNSYFIFANRNYYSRDDIENFSKCDYKEITLPDLRDMVVLKRNDVGDATHSDPMYPYIKLSDGWYYFDKSGKWLKSTGGKQSYYDNLKPITKEEGMKEYLDPENGYELNLTDRPFFDWIEIPEGANFAWKSDSKYVFFTALEMGYRDAAVVWSRHTHPEELPFIDDDFKLNIPEELKGRTDLLSGRIIIDDEPKIETATGYQLDVVGSNTYGARSRDTGESDIYYRQYLMNFIVGNRTKSLNDQYAEIEGVRQTLKTRQEQYGSFEDVAMITEQMVDVMRKGYYEKLAYNQKMALYMICSKMARIVNGNPNHKDSWHDIAGYATLIDNELVSEKDMPF